ncbi:MAG: PAS domain-containing sensor histidine kinase, partial [Pseudomonadota bacterium]
TVETIDREVLIAMIVANVLIAVGFMALIGARLWHVWSDRRNQLAGSRTHMQLVGVFSIVAVVPAVLAFLFAFTMLRTSFDDVFSDRTDENIGTTLQFVNNYFQNEANKAGLNLVQIETDLKGDAELLGFTPARTPILFRKRLEQQAGARNLAALFVLDGERRIIARVIMSDASFNLPVSDVFDAVDRAALEQRPRKEWGNFSLNDENQIDMFRTLLKTDSYEGGYLISYQFIPPSLSEGLRAIRTMRDDWKDTSAGRSRIERVFAASYVLLALIILFGAIWLALWAATRFVRPIGRLVQMADRVSSGELNARVDVQKSDGELGALARSMNHMTAQLQTQRNDLIETNRQFDARRRFTEAVLSGVSAGVIGVSQSGRITISNRSAADLIGVEATRLQGAALKDILPEIEPLFLEARDHAGVEVADQVEFERDGRTKTINVRIASDEMNGERSFVVTFDDITQLVAAQRSAAWGDVARRIAHEIKNPLTPIQLSAERLRRKYADEVKSSPEIFDKCTETIIRHVSDIGRMVDEFSSFARMPKPVIAEEDVFELVKAAVFPQRVAFPEIQFVSEGPETAIAVECDGRLIVQALSNILKNAGESISARVAGGDATPGVIKVSVSNEGQDAVIDIIDNGVGLPEKERHRLTEPYMTTRAKGTGLGLASVRKVIEEHGGVLTFSDDRTLGDTGARMRMTLPVTAEASAGARTEEDDAALTAAE